jgi:hypothetical protein
MLRSLWTQRAALRVQRFQRRSKYQTLFRRRKQLVQKRDIRSRTVVPRFYKQFKNGKLVRKPTRSNSSSTASSSAPPPPPPLPKPQILTLPASPLPFNIEDYAVNSNDFKTQPIRVDQDLKWPSFLTPIYVLSMRPYRYNDLVQRFKNWSNLLTLVPAIDGSKINYDDWGCKLGRLKVCQTRGRIGCYESHVRIWKRLLDANLPHALVLEDDADIHYNEKTVAYLTQCLQELQQVPNWDIVYIGNNTLHPFKRQVTEHLFELTNWEGAYTYLIRNRCAKIFYDNAFPITDAVDLYMAEQFQKHNLLALALHPRLNYVVESYPSDTI